MSPLPIGVALSGGTAKSMFHIGAIRAFEEAGLPIDYLAGTSGGSIVAVMIASGMPFANIEELAGRMSWWKLASIKLTKLGFVSSEPIQHFIKDVLQDANFEDLAIPCAVPVTNLLTGGKAVFKTGPVAPVVRASCSIPQIYLPVELNGDHYVDGGLSEYLPVETVRDFGEQFTIGINLSTKRSRYQRPQNILQLIMQITNMIAKQNISHSMRCADFLLNPDIDAFSSFDFGKTRQLIEMGYRHTNENMDALQATWRKKSRAWRRLLHRIQGPNTHNIRANY